MRAHAEIGVRLGPSASALLDLDRPAAPVGPDSVGGLGPGEGGTFSTRGPTCTAALEMPTSTGAAGNKSREVWEPEGWRGSHRASGSGLDLVMASLAFIEVVLGSPGRRGPLAPFSVLSKTKDLFPTLHFLGRLRAPCVWGGERKATQKDQKSLS